MGSINFFRNVINLAPRLKFVRTWRVENRSLSCLLLLSNFLRQKSYYFQCGRLEWFVRLQICGHD